MSSFGVLPTGFRAKTLEELLLEIQEAERASFGPGINLLATSVFGQINGIFAEHLAELWEVAQGIYGAAYPDSASDAALDNVLSLTGVLRDPARKSHVHDLICTGTAATFLATGRVLSVENSGARFASTADATLALATARAPATAYVVGDIRSNDNNIYYVTVAGTSGGGGGPTGEGTAIVDGTVTWRFVGDGLSFAEVEYEAEVTGPIDAPSWSLHVIETPVAGWLGADNPTDVHLGADGETDADARLRRNDLLRASGSATVEALRGRVLEIVGVTQVFVFENTSMLTDGDGLPAKSFEVVVEGGDGLLEQTIADMIWLHKPAGIESYGNISQSVVDSQGFAHTIKLSRPDDVILYVAITLAVNAAVFPADGVEQVRAALLSVADTLNIGDDVVMLAFSCAPLRLVPGVIDVPSLKIDTVDPPVNTANIAIGNREFARFDSARIVVTVA